MKLYNIANADIAQQKESLRKASVQILQKGCNTNWNWAVEKLLSLPQYINAKTVFCFVPLPNEPLITQFLQTALQSGKCICVPKCIAKGAMQARQITNLRQLKTGKYNIQEPTNQSREILPGEVDFAVMPCVCCGKDGTRLGHGGGYYDRFMQNLLAYKAVVCFDEVLFDTVPSTMHDIKANAIITQTLFLEF